MKSMLVIRKRLRKRMTKDQHQDGNFTIALNNSQIDKVRSRKFLRVEIDDDLTLENHCNALTKKVSKRIDLLKYISPYFKERP